MPKVLIAGGTGLVGNRLSQKLTERGYEVTHLSRNQNLKSPYPTFIWNIEKKFIDERAFHHIDFIINLAGAGIADALWTSSRRKLIIDSRVQSTQLLTEYIQNLEHKPNAYLSAAAIGIYGNRGDEILTEKSNIGNKGFLVEACQQWEKAIKLAALENSVRTAALRIGIVLSSKGGALEKMMLPLKFFVGTYFGDGKQWTSWIHIDDLCNQFIFLLENEKAEGFYNATAPNPVTNKELIKQLIAVSGKKAFLLSTPPATLRIGMGEMADVVLHGQRVLPQRFLEEGFQFQFPEIKEAIQNILNG